MIHRNFSHNLATQAKYESKNILNILLLLFFFFFFFGLSA
jgi:hypothetical protein